MKSLVVLFLPIKSWRGGKGMKKTEKLLFLCSVALVLTLLFCAVAYAAPTGDVAGAIEGTWHDASSQIKTVVNKVVFAPSTSFWPYSFSLSRRWPILIIASMGSLSGPRRQSYLFAFYSP